MVKSATGKNILYVKGAPEIVFGMCKNTCGVTDREVNAQLLEYQKSPIERPTWAVFSAGASFVPSPVTATISLFAWSASTETITYDDTFIYCESEKTRKGYAKVIRQIPISPMLKKVLPLIRIV